VTLALLDAKLADRDEAVAIWRQRFLSASVSFTGHSYPES
jgi:hypothetical protein